MLVAARCRGLCTSPTRHRLLNDDQNDHVKEQQNEKLKIENTTEAKLSKMTEVKITDEDIGSSIDLTRIMKAKLI